MASPIYDLAAYAYSALERPHSFRLLRLMPNPDESAYIHCTIEHFDRGSDYCPPYTALSYAWGDAKTTFPILLNAPLSGLQTFAFVTENLREALSYLRRARAYILLWVDALSINQEDPRERGHQVSQMRAIYSEASYVISWLGQGDRYTDRLFAFIRKHHYACTIHGGLAGTCGFTVDHGLADALRYLEERPYWIRIWVIQEIVVATNLEIMCGEESVSWSIFAKFWPLIFEDHFKKPHGMNRRLAPPIHSSAILPLRSWRRVNISLSYALDLTGLSRATDGRDRVYALLGLVDQGSGRHIVVDYTISSCNVFLVATQALIRDWTDDGDNDEVRIYTREERLNIMLSQTNIEPTSRQRIKGFKSGLAGITAPCETIAHLRQYIRFLLGYSDNLDLDVVRSTADTKVEDCDGENCGSWAAMYKAATVQKHLPLHGNQTRTTDHLFTQFKQY